MNLTEVQKNAIDLSKRNGWSDSEDIEVRIKYLKREVEEAVAEIKALSISTSDDERRVITERLGYELSDIIWNVGDIANRYGINLSESFQAKMEINNKRVWA